MTQNSPELLLRGDRAVVEPWAQRDAFHAVVNGLGGSIIRPGDVARETKLRDNSFYLTAGDHSGIKWTTTGSRLFAAPGARMTRLAVFESDADVSGLEFSSVGSENNKSHLVSIGAKGNVTFTNCRFRKNASDDPTFVNVVSGGKARFIGCYFGPEMDIADNVFDNLLVDILNVMLIGHNGTGNPLGDITAVAVTQ